eukprot:3025972-Pyramimonas_sp.AAC.1
MAFILNEFSPERAFTDVDHLSSRLADDVISKSKVRVPRVDVFVAGFSCTSRTPCSSRASSNRNCVQHQDDNAETSFTFTRCFRYISKATPSWVVLECVKELTHISDDSA